MEVYNMSVATELTKLQGYMGDAFDAVEEKGGTLPTTECMAELADAILSIATGGGAVVSGLGQITVSQKTGSISGTVPVGGALAFFDSKGTSRYNTNVYFKKNNSSGAYATFKYKESSSPSSEQTCTGTLIPTSLYMGMVNNTDDPIYFSATGDNHTYATVIFSPAS